MWYFSCALQQLGLQFTSSWLVGVNGDLPVFDMSLHNPFFFFHLAHREAANVNYQKVVCVQVSHALDYRIL